ncbi:hypothetical protein [Nocardioides jishulii]|uniref:Uncharacterized protein n=1 Tax=Nocardioides jishulii TaxID=2575440 RepID=A0A4U2YVG2_9ACTN|nr:hypothetical protein [Nocardioides jishulii]QCX28978.1 hypothetical protein FCL41_16715 [Nocardioides jishulii]TKI64121.1 hypothetical protein FC770_02850 [Nocardioides jishulii]
MSESDFERSGEFAVFMLALSLSSLFWLCLALDDVQRNGMGAKLGIGVTVTGIGCLVGIVGLVRWARLRRGNRPSKD